MSWLDELRYDPIVTLNNSKNTAIRYFAAHDLLGSDRKGADSLWQLPEARRLIEDQQDNGSWSYHGGKQHIRSQEDYDQIETFRVLRKLVEEFAMDKSHPSIPRAAKFLFGHQTDEGDFRGICGRQYVPYYSGAIMELLIKAGYAEDPRIQKGFKWLISIRQDDGGWAFPLRTVGMILDTHTFHSGTVMPDRSKPFSHLITGMVLRAFAAHSDYRVSKEAHLAGELLSSRLFRADRYSDRQAPQFWTSFSYPFWFTDLLSALDSLSWIGFNPVHPDVSKGVKWFLDKQNRNGLWKLRLRAMAKESEPDFWITLAICRLFKRLYR